MAERNGFEGGTAIASQESGGVVAIPTDEQADQGLEF